MTAINFTKSLKASAKEVLTKNIHLFVNVLIKFWGQVSIYEWLHAVDVAKVYFDVDGKASETTAEALLADAHSGVRLFLGIGPDDPLPRMMTMFSHGGDKLSYRLVLPDYRMKIADQKKRLVRLDLDKNRPFDAAVYGVNQKLRTAGSYKTKDVRRVMDLQREGPLTDADVVDTVVQHVTDEMELLTEAADTANAPSTSSAAPMAPSTSSAPPTTSTDTAPRKRGRRSVSDTIPQIIRTLLEAVGFRDVRSQDSTEQGYNFTSANRTTANPCPCCPHIHDSNRYYVIVKPDVLIVSNYSDRCNRRVIQRQVEEEMVPIDEAGFDSAVNKLALADNSCLGAERDRLHYHTYQVACTRPECYACERCHDTDQVLLKQVIPRVAWTIQSISPGCEPRFFYTTQELYHLIGSVLVNPAHQTIASLFLHGHRGTLWADSINDVKYWTYSTDDPERLYHWKTLDRSLFTEMVGSWLTDLVVSMRHLPQLRDAGKQINTLWHLVSTHSNIQGICQTLVGKIKATTAGDKIKFDANPYLLGCDNGVIDLQGTDSVFRSARRDDYVTKSVGYKFPGDDHVTDADRELLTEYMTVIYPVPEERDFVQRYLGYCLLGHHHEPILLCLTDTRDGQNGKTTVINFVADALGNDYYLEGEPNCTITDNRQDKEVYRPSLNDHTIDFCHYTASIVTEIKYMIVFDASIYSLHFVSCLRGGLSTASIQVSWLTDASSAGPKGFLYRQSRPEDGNSHDSGLLKFEGKRVSGFEEPQTGFKLDTDTLKKYNGGKCVPLVRAPHATESRPMEFVTKMILAFNSGGFPNIPVDQESTNAFLKRVVVINHRALFCKTTEEFQSHRHEPYTYLGDPTKVKLDRLRLRPAMLAWMIEGYGDYTRQGFTTIPEACTAWKQRLVDENDIVAQWIYAEDPIQQDADVHFSAKAAYMAFLAAGFKLGKIRFNDLLKKRFRNEWRERSTDCKERNVFVGLRLKDSG